jgi:hypothetical protein
VAGWLTDAGIEDLRRRSRKAIDQAKEILRPT